MIVRSDGAAAAVKGGSDADRSASRLLDPSWSARVAARLRGTALDRALIDGADPAASPQLAAHTARLAKHSTRSGVADSLDRLARTHAEPARLWGVLPSREAIRANLGDLLALAALLRGPSPVYAQGVAMVRRLVADGTGPAYSDPDGCALAAQLRSVRRAMTG